MKTTTLFLRNIISRNKFLLTVVFSLTAIGVLTCVYKNTGEDVPETSISVEFLHIAGSDKCCHFLMPCPPANTISRDVRLDRIEEIITNSGSEDVDYFVCMTEDALTPEERRIFRINGRKSKILKITRNMADSLEDRFGNRPGLVILTDRKGSVVESGDVMNPADKQRFYDRLRHDLPKSSLTIRNPEVHALSGRMDTTLWLKNEGKTPLLIYEVESSCTCSSSVVGKRQVMPGDSTDMRISYRNMKHRDFVSTINVYSNSEGSPHTIRIHAD